MSQEFSEKPRRKYYSKAIKAKVVMHIVEGEYLVEEVMEIYGISCRRTIIRWLSDYVKKQKSQKSR